jgi:spore maturation protein CgeB
MVRQMLLGLQSAGVDVYEYNTDENPAALDCEGRPYDRGRFGPVWLKWDAVGPLIERFQPDLIVCNAGGLSLRPENADALRRSVSLLGIALSDPDVFEASTSRIAANFDLFLTNAPGCIPAYRAAGANVKALPLATNPDFFQPRPARPEYQCEVLVVGRAHPDRIAPVRRLCDQFSVHIHGEEWESAGLPGRPALYGEDLLSALNSARISVIFSRTPAGHSIAKIAVFDFLAAGALVATERIPEIEPYLRYDDEIIGFTDTDALMTKLRYYLEHPQQAEKVRAAGRRRVLEDHSWSKVWPRIFEQLEQLQERKEIAC